MKYGWRQLLMLGSHRVVRHERKPGIVVAPGNPGDGIPPGALRAIFKQAGLAEQLS